MSQKYPIDIVILWVNGNDPDWVRRFNQYAPRDKQREIDCSGERYRDWELLRYWFRGIEQFAPWVRTVHFVTSGERPQWLNLDCPKLHWVRHEDYLPTDCLPLFNACAIEDSIHRIPGLAEHFVFFNDDFFLLRPLTPERFFRDGLPCDMAIANTIQSEGMMGHITLNDLDCINHFFNKHACMRAYARKWFAPCYRTFLLRTLALMPWPRFSGFFDHHLPQPFLRSTFEEVWQAYPDELQAATYHRFRHTGDVNQWLFRYWQLCKGTFAPYNVMRDAVAYFLTNDNFTAAEQCIRRQEKDIIVLNDEETLTDFSQKKAQLIAAFESILPQLSSFEK